MLDLVKIRRVDLMRSLIFFLVSLVAGVAPIIDPDTSIAISASFFIAIPILALTLRLCGYTATVITIVAALSRAVVAILQWRLDLGYFFGDSHYYHMAALSLIRGDKLVPIANLHPYVVGAILYLVGDRPIVAATILAVMSSIVVPITWILARAVGLNKPYLPACVVAFLPEFVAWSSFLLKDGTIYVLTYAILLAIWSLYNKPRFAPLLIACVLIALLSGYRLYQTIEVLTAAGLAAVMCGLRRRRTLIIASACIISLIWLGYGTPLQRFISLGGLADARQVFYEGSTIIYQPDEGLLQALVKGLISLWLYPFPWLWISGGITTLTSVTAPIWYVIYPLGITEAIKSVMDRPFLSKMIGFYVLIVSLLYAVVISNAGALYRHRLELLPAIAILASASIRRISVSKRQPDTPRQLRPGQLVIRQSASSAR